MNSEENLIVCYFLFESDTRFDVLSSRIGREQNQKVWYINMEYIFTGADPH